MSEIKVSKLTNRAGTGSPDFNKGLNVSGSASSILAPTRSDQVSEPDSADWANGDTWWNDSAGTYAIRINDEWKYVIGEGASSVTPWYGDRGVFMRYATGNPIQYIDITTAGNAQDFGDGLSTNRGMGGTADGSRGLFGGGNIDGTQIFYITVSSTGNGTDFGDLTSSRDDVGACSDATYGVFWGGSNTTIDYVTIQTTGNATDFGDTTSSASARVSCWSNGTRGVGAGFQGINEIHYITIATTGNTTDFGDLTVARDRCACGGDDTRTIWGGGYDPSTTSATNIMDYITTGTTGNATDFGDLTTVRYWSSAASNATRTVFAGGANQAHVTMDYVTTQTTGNATDFGDLLSNYGSNMASSNVSGAAA